MLAKAYSHSRLTANKTILFSYNILCFSRNENESGPEGVRRKCADSTLNTYSSHKSNSNNTYVYCVLCMHEWIPFLNLHATQLSSTQFDQIHRFCLFYSVCSNKTTHIHHSDTNKYTHAHAHRLGYFIFFLTPNVHLNFIHSKIYVTLQCVYINIQTNIVRYSVWEK